MIVKDKHSSLMDLFVSYAKCYKRFHTQFCVIFRYRKRRGGAEASPQPGPDHHRLAQDRQVLSDRLARLLPESGGDPGHSPGRHPAGQEALLHHHNGERKSPEAVSAPGKREERSGPNVIKPFMSDLRMFVISKSVCPWPGNTKWGSITVPLTSCLTGL